MKADLDQQMQEQVDEEEVNEEKIACGIIFHLSLPVIIARLNNLTMSRQGMRIAQTSAVIFLVVVSILSPGATSGSGKTLPIGDQSISASSATIWEIGRITPSVLPDWIRKLGSCHTGTDRTILLL